MGRNPAGLSVPALARQQQATSPAKTSMARARREAAVTVEITPNDLGSKTPDLTAPGVASVQAAHLRR
jgi:hypothetical protein